MAVDCYAALCWLPKGIPQGLGRRREPRKGNEAKELGREVEERNWEPLSLLHTGCSSPSQRATLCCKIGFPRGEQVKPPPPGDVKLYDVNQVLQPAA